jgi:hypothetical protein
MNLYRNNITIGDIPQLDVVVPSFFPRDGLVAYYKLDGNSNDAHGSNNGTDSGITYNASYGKIGQGALGNGTSYTSIPSQAAFNLQSSFTLLSWVYLTSYGKSTSYEEQIIAKDNLTSGNRCFSFIVRGPADSGNKGKLRFCYNPILDTSVFSTGVIPLNTWTQVALVSTAGTYTFYINGVASGSGSTNITPVYQGIAPLSLRSGYNSQYVESMIGYQDEVGIWSRALTSDEITQLYNNGNGLTY